ncbi:MAG: cupin-like domain-containing protein [Caldimonas sp.]
MRKSIGSDGGAMSTRQRSIGIPPAPRPGARVQVPMNDDWRQWIAENRLRNCTPQSMLDSLVGFGLDRGACEEAMRDMERNPAFLAALKFQQLQRKLESVLANQQRLWESAPAYGVVERRSDVSTAEFVERYVRPSRPLVMTDLACDWPAMRRWSPAYLQERFGHLDVDIQVERQGDPRYEENKLEHQRKIRLSTFVDQVMSGGASNDYYMTANNEVLRRPEFAPLLADIGTLPAFCDRSQLAQKSSFWFGPAGTVTPLHHDTVMLLHTQVVGRKRWRFISPLDTPKLYNFSGVFSPIDIDNPDLARYPRFAEVKTLEVVLEPGDTVFLPLGWWHQVCSLETSLSFSFSNLAMPNEFTYDNPAIHNW